MAGWRETSDVGQKGKPAAVGMCPGAADRKRKGGTINRKQGCFRHLAAIGARSGFRAVQGRHSRQIIVSWENSDASSISRLNKRVESRHR